MKIVLAGPLPDHSESIPNFLAPFLNTRPTFSLWHLEKAIKKAQLSENIEGIYLDVTKLTGGWANLKSLRKILANFKSTGKFIYVYAENYSEKSYYLATVADKIFAYPQGGFELDGLGSPQMFLPGFLEKLKLKVEVFKVGSYKSAIEPLDSKKHESRVPRTDECPI